MIIRIRRKKKKKKKNKEKKNQADAAGEDPQSWLYDYLLGNVGTNLIYIPAANYAGGIPELLKHPHTVAALGDGGAHVGSICDASANLYLITKWVKQQAQIELSQGIRMLTEQPAELYSLTDRGRIEVGMKADIRERPLPGPTWRPKWPRGKRTTYVSSSHWGLIQVGPK